jgi:GNAT superfamily N-acetyltransferase
VDLIIPLRHAVLRAHLPFDSARFDGDGDPATLHVAALIAGNVIGCASWMLNAFQGEPAYQLRGMAVAESERGTGIGQRLLNHSESLLAHHPVKLRWCNARQVAVGFYERQGWTVMSPVFDIPSAGPHYQMSRRLPVQ